MRALQGLRGAAALALAAVVLAAQAADAQAAARDTYAQQLTAAGRQLTAALGGLGAVAGMSIQYPVKPTTGRRAAAKLAAVQSSLRALSSSLGAMHPPAAVRVYHVRLTRGVAALASQVSPVLKRIRAGYLVDAAKLVELPALNAVGAAITALRKHGYKIG